MARKYLSRRINFCRPNKRRERKTNLHKICLYIHTIGTVHQILCITSVDFARKTIYGFVELHILPQAPIISKILLNCRQCKIYRICIKGQGLESWLEAAFTIEEYGNLSGHDAEWKVENFTANLKQNILKTEAENSGGEISVRLPSETMPLVEGKEILRVSVEFVLENPSSGLHFVIPPGEDSLIERSCHIFSHKWGHSNRSWFPCIDSLSDICTWKIEVTMDKGFEVVCPGDLIEKVVTPDEKRVTHHFTVTTPTTASNIGIAIGPFSIDVDPELCDVTFFSLPLVSELVINTVSFLSEAFEFLEELLNTPYPHSSFKLVFVDEAYANCQTFQSMAILNTSLLHSDSIIEQPFTTRIILLECLIEQYFGAFVSPQTWADIWLIRGITLYLTGLFIKKMFGNNEYRHWLMEEMKSLCAYEIEGPTLPPLYPYASVSMDGKHDTSQQDGQSMLLQHPRLMSSIQLKMMETKSHLVMRMIELRIGQDLLLQTFNKVLSLTSSAATKRSDCTQWQNMMLSTVGFLKTISTVSGKDIKVFVDKWVCNTGVAKFNASFSFNRKRNIIELEINQFAGKGCQKYVGPLIVCIQELDGSFSHTVQVEENPSHHELSCHSKSRRNKKKKIPLVTGEEVDMDLSATFDTDSPVLWVRIDPDMTWTRRVVLEQPDYMWQYQLRYERDVISQVEAVFALERYPCSGTRSALIDTINQSEAFYKVRMEATSCLAKIATAELEVWNGEKEMIDIHNRIFGTNSCPSIPRFNDYSNFIKYFLQKTIPFAISTIRKPDGHCSKQIIHFLQNLLKFRDNRFNQYSDGYYISSLLDAIVNTVGPIMHDATEMTDSSILSPTGYEAKIVLEEVNRHLNMEKLLPSYKYSVTCSCLKAIRRLQVQNHIPAESAIFRNYTQYGLYEEVRLTALSILVEFVHTHSSLLDFEWLLDFLEYDPVPRMKHFVVNCMVEHPPFKKNDVDSKLNNMKLVESFWKIMSCTNDIRLGCDLMNVYSILWGKTTPSCYPNFVEYRDSVPALSSKKRRRPYNVANMHDNLESYQNTPSSMSAESPASNKIKLKIKIAGEENATESDAEVPFKKATDICDPLALMDDNNSVSAAKKVKKKKKKKHRHKDKKGTKMKDPLNFDNSSIPGVNRDLLDDRLAGSSPESFFDSHMLSATSEVQNSQLDLMGDTFQDVSLFKHKSEDSDSG